MSIIVEIATPPDIVVEIVGEATIAEIGGAAAVVVEVGQYGPQGVPGIPGAPGPSGQSYTHNQNAPASTWVIAHNLGFVPGGILIEDSAGETWEGEVTIDSINQITVSFGASSFSGVAYLS